MTERSLAHKIAADVLASQHMRADRTVQDLAPLAREFLKLSKDADTLRDMQKLAVLFEANQFHG